MEIIAVLAMERNGGIGKNNDLPWPTNQEDLDWFTTVADDSLAVMGRNTYMGFPTSIGNNTKVVISSSIITDDITITPSINPSDLKDQLISLAQENGRSKIVIMGGKVVYEWLRNIVDVWYISQIEESYESDVILDKKYLTYGKTMVDCKRLNSVTVVEKYISG